MKKRKVCLFGRHANRTPLAYKEYQTLFSEHFQLVKEVESADIIVLGYSVDLYGLIKAHHNFLARNKNVKCLVISEEPLWDLISKNYPLDTKIQFEHMGLSIEVGIANFFNSNIYKFSKIPYFITTESHYAARYLVETTNLLNAFDKNKLLTHWKSISLKSCFLQQKRTNDVFFPEQYADIALSSYRTTLATRLKDNKAMVKGMGWGNDGPRQAIPDWHLDKLLTYRRRFPIFSAIENTLLDDYITEKIFDAFMLGSVPIYIANSSHRVFELINQESMINLSNTSETVAAEILSDWTPSTVNMDAYFDSLEKIRKLFSATETLLMERQRVVREVVKLVQKNCN
ncbi:glycosyltransferase family 10 [Alteromonas sp. KUL106]|uniref:glycosyltransferase family 10 domain-containing protein n=1 Tax=Alteromonas sp. KUL106 TaxID=2480799 RepID=UPI0012E66F72|nr:glycosyltransferase family 10 [Alteromonas sp. KUL106]GFD69172.1 hypothetical protein KUL106_24350 [Alteromonas sp. KUL106]